jgi:cytoskeleton protein RodZ
MISVGDTLRRERIKRNLQLEQISKELKISPRFLEAIEDERFEKLPGGVFARAFVRQYGRLLGLNEDELASQLDQVLEPAIDMDAENAQAPRTSLAPIQMPRLEEWKTVGDRRVTWSGPLSAAIVVVLVMLVCSGVYAWIQRQHNPVVAHNTAPLRVATQTQPAQTQVARPQPTEPQPQSQSSSPATQPSESAPVAGAPAPVQQPQTATQNAGATNAPPAQTPAATDQNASTTPSAPGPVHIEITASEPVWVLARTDGKFAFTGTMDANTKRTIDATKDITLRLGNAGGVTITLNGQPIPAVGPKGQPRTIQFTSGGFHIVPAKPPSDSPDPVARL